MSKEVVPVCPAAVQTHRRPGVKLIDAVESALGPTTWCEPDIGEDVLTGKACAGFDFICGPIHFEPHIRSAKKIRAATVALLRRWADELEAASFEEDGSWPAGE